MIFLTLIFYMCLLPVLFYIGINLINSTSCFLIWTVIMSLYLIGGKVLLSLAKE